MTVPQTAGLAHCTAAVIHVGAVTVPGFAAATDLGLLAVLAGVVWFIADGALTTADVADRIAS
jgi:hypothetical protein